MTGFFLSSQMLGKYGLSAELIWSADDAPVVSFGGLPWPSIPEEAGADAICTAESVLKGPVAMNKAYHIIHRFAVLQDLHGFRHLMKHT